MFRSSIHYKNLSITRLQGFETLRLHIHAQSHSFSWLTHPQTQTSLPMWIEHVIKSSTQLHLNLAKNVRHIIFKHPFPNFLQYILIILWQCIDVYVLWHGTYTAARVCRVDILIRVLWKYLNLKKNVQLNKRCIKFLQFNNY